MKKSIKKILSMFIATFMAISVPVTVFASVNSVMTLQLDSDKFYAGRTYNVIATVDNLTEAEVIGFDDSTIKSAFNWGITSATNIKINSLNDYSYVLNEDTSTYTVTEKASFTMPISQSGLVVSGNVVINASYSDIADKTFTITKTLQPITNLSVNSATTAHTYFDGSSVYIDSGNTAYFDVSCSPSTNDDVWDAVSSDPYKGTTDHVIINKTDGAFSATATSSCDSSSTITISPDSGYAFQKEITLYKCVPLTKFTLNLGTGTTTLSAAVTEDTFNPEVNVGSTNVIAGDELVLSTANRNTSNDKFQYSVFTDINCTMPLSETNYTLSVNNESTAYPCSISFNTAGTYYVKCHNISLDGGNLYRNLMAVTKVTVTEAKPISTLGFYELNADNTFSDTELDEITLYTNSSSTYDISKNLKIGPEGYTDGVVYSSTNTSVATVSATGLITAKATGQIVLCVQSTKSGTQAFCTVNVFVGITSITRISVEYGTLPLGHSETLSVVTSPAVTQETISWSCNNSDALLVDASTGKITANPNYDFEGNDEVYVTVTATSQFGKTASYPIKVVPAIRAEVMDLQISSGSVIESISDDEKSLFIGSTFTLNATAKDTNGNTSNDILDWRVSVDDEAFLSTADLEDYLTYTFNADGSLKITTKTTKTLTFYVFGELAGQVFDSNSPYCCQITIHNKEKITGMTAYTPAGSKTTAATITTGATTDIVIKLTNDLGYNVDQLTFTSSNEDVATVEKTGINTATITGVSKGDAKINVTCDSGSKTLAYSVTVSNNIGFANVTGVKNSYVFTGSAFVPIPSLVYGTIELLNNVDYKYAYTNNVNAGTATLTFTGLGTYLNSKKIINFTIEQKPMTNDCISIGAIALQKLSSTVPAATPKPAVKDLDRNKTLVLGTDYTLTYENNTGSGTATVTVNGIGNYKGSVSANFQVADIATKFQVNPISDQYYTGSVITPLPTVTYFNTVLKKDVDYTLSYTNNKSVGTATIKITGINGYTGYKTVTFKINPAAMAKPTVSSRTSSKIALKWVAVSGSTGYQVYNVTTGKLYTFSSSTTSCTFSSLSSMKRYQFKIRRYYKSSSGITYYGKYSSVTTVYTNPKATSISGLSTKSKTITVKWKKVAYSGYQIQYCTKSSFSGAKTVTISGGSSTSKKISKLSRGKKYYVRVRTYKTISGKKYYSSWSAKKSIKCK